MSLAAVPDDGDVYIAGSGMSHADRMLGPIWGVTCGNGWLFRASSQVTGLHPLAGWPGRVAGGGPAVTGSVSWAAVTQLSGSCHCPVTWPWAVTTIPRASCADEQTALHPAARWAMMPRCLSQAGDPPSGVFFRTGGSAFGDLGVRDEKISST